MLQSDSHEFDTELKDHQVIDDHGDKVGKITDVLFDDEGNPAWVVVNPGFFAGAHFVPLAPAYKSDDGALVVPYDKSMVKGSPRVTKDHVLTHKFEEDLKRYYALDTPETASH